MSEIEELQMEELGMLLVRFMLIGTGVVYFVKPDLFQRWFWKRTAVSQRLLTPEQNRVYMRVLGCVCIVIGVLLMFVTGDEP